MYTQWLFPFEAVSLLLLVAILGAVVVAKPRI
jgi:NADH-quinone oxidoreductase subunit J